jgi:hypothetical protein
VSIVASMGCGRRRVMWCVVESGGGVSDHSRHALSLALVYHPNFRGGLA